MASSPSAYDYLKSRLQSPASVYDKTSYCKLSRKVSKPGDLYLELSNRSQIWQAHRQHCCPRCLSNFKAMQWFKPPISRLRDFPRSHDTTSYRIMKRDPDISRPQCGFIRIMINNPDLSVIRSQLKMIWFYQKIATDISLKLLDKVDFAMNYLKKRVVCYIFKNNW